VAIGSEQLRIAAKDPCRLVLDENANLTGGAPLSVDGVNVATFDRILVIGQTSADENGIYVVQTPGSGSNGTWARARDADSSLKVFQGVTTWITSGSSYQYRRFVLSTSNPIVLDTTPLSFQPVQPEWSLQTVDATPANMPFNGTPAQFRLRNDSAVKFTLEILGRSSTGDVTGFRINGVIRRGANAASTTLVGSVIESVGADASLATALASVVADTTNGALAPRVTGVAATTIDWKATISYTMVG
jgi:hypothetical protein